MNLNYSINGVSFSSLGIYVTSSDDVLPGLKLKEPLSVNWPGSHGLAMDLSLPRYEARTLSLDCVLIASGADAWVTSYNALIDELRKTGTQRLQINAVTNKPFVFEVYSRDGLNVKKKWRDGKMTGTFTLNLTEPQPVKWVLKAVGSTSVSLNITSEKPLHIAWGDGTHLTVQGTNQAASKTFSGNSAVSYYVIVAGELETISVNSQSNLTELWPRLY